MEQKCDIATRELDELREEVQRKKAEMERSHDTHKVTVCMLASVFTDSDLSVIPFRL